MKLDDPRLIGQLLQSRLATGLVLAIMIGFMLHTALAALMPTFAKISAAFAAIS